MPFDGILLTQTQRDLIAGRQLLIEQGWVPRCGSRNGPHCASTALAGRDDAWNALLRAANLHISKDLFSWNDRQTSIKPVLALFDKAIAEAGQETSP